MTVPTSRFVRAGGVNLHYADWGGGGRTLLLLHGDMRTSRSWDAAARDLRSDFRVLALDMRGHGDSDWPESGYTFAQRADDLESFADSVGLRGVAVAAHSTGGVVAALLAERRPDIFSRLALLEPMVVVTESFQRMVSKRAETPRRTWASQDEMREYLKWHRMTGKWRDDVIEDVVEHESCALPKRAAGHEVGDGEHGVERARRRLPGLAPHSADAGQANPIHNERLARERLLGRGPHRRANGGFRDADHSGQRTQHVHGPAGGGVSRHSPICKRGIARAAA